MKSTARLTAEIPRSVMTKIKVALAFRNMTIQQWVLKCAKRLTK